MFKITEAELKMALGRLPAPDSIVGHFFIVDINKDGSRYMLFQKRPRKQISSAGPGDEWVLAMDPDAKLPKGGQTEAELLLQIARITQTIDVSLAAERKAWKSGQDVSLRLADVLRIDKALREEISALNLDVLNLEEKLSEVRKTASETLPHGQVMRSDLVDMTVQRDHMIVRHNNLVDSSNAEIKKLNAETNAITSELAGSLNREDALADENEKLNTRRNDHESKLAQAQHETNDANRSLGKANRDVEDLKGQLAVARIELKESRKCEEELKADMDGFGEVLSRQAILIDDGKRERDALKMDRDDLDQMLKQRSIAFVESKLQVAGLDSDLKKALQREEELKADLNGFGWAHDAAEQTASEIRKKYDSLVKALTPSPETKVEYWGTFMFDASDFDENGDLRSRSHTVPWTTVKEIIVNIRKVADHIHGGNNL